MNILVTLNSVYLKPLKVMLKSLFYNNPQDNFTIYLMHSSISAPEIRDLEKYIYAHGHRLEVIFMEDEYFSDAPVLLHYTREMYYRLLAFKFLPPKLERILYLDPDILVLNPVRGLYATDLRDYLYAAAYHDKITVKEINKIRLGSYTMEQYYNSGVLLMNLELQRQQTDERAIYNFVKKNRIKLIMPDQDILNALYAENIKSLDEKLYNYDARYYHLYKMMSDGSCDMDYVIRHTVILHFCGKKKPWQKTYSGKFHALYKHYEKMAENISDNNKAFCLA